MALKNVSEWNEEKKTSSACGTACGTACGAADEPQKEAPAACGAADEPKEDKPSACGTACGASDK